MTYKNLNNLPLNFHTCIFYTQENIYLGCFKYKIEVETRT